MVAKFLTDHFVVQVEQSIGWVCVCLSVCTITFEPNRPSLTWIFDVMVRRYFVYSVVYKVRGRVPIKLYHFSVVQDAGAFNFGVQQRQGIVISASSPTDDFIPTSVYRRRSL